MTADPAEIRVLAKIALRDYRKRRDRVPPWIIDLVGETDPIPDFRMYHRLRIEGLISWSCGWHLTETGRWTLEAMAARDRL